MTPRETYPHGVSCFIDTERNDVDAAMAFYSGLFGWSFKQVTPEGAPRYALAQVDGLDVAGIGEASGNGAAPAWNTYIAVESADAIVERVERAGGSTLVAPFDFSAAGRMAIFADPEGAAFRVWQAGEAAGAGFGKKTGAREWGGPATPDNPPPET